MKNYDLPIAGAESGGQDDRDDSAYTIGLPERNDSDELQQQEIIIDKIKDATMKITGACSCWFTDWCWLKFIPYRRDSYIPRKDSGAAMASDVANVEASVAEILVREWQDVKSQALGPDHFLGKLSEVRISYLVFPLLY
ncbi:unnamed protein product [Fraxinus pennsylvanica]|uniref:Uncharacterized protein n=1 Tax=Fraxinus pennsylvanica TaxID=56036 RepID=A0AAD2DMV1_9LAMI|nr:unnamed protein product [Fraxinus pennsylvanica]